MFDFSLNVPKFGQSGIDKYKIMFYNINRNNVPNKLFLLFKIE